MKALEKDRGRRYDGPSYLAADIEHVLKNEPINARPPTVIYKARSRDELLELDVALSKLAEEDPQAARVVEMRYFAEMGQEEIATALGVTA